MNILEAMPFYIRKIDRAKWSKTDANTGDITADAITNDLATRSNQLSFWIAETEEEKDVNEILIAIMSTFTSGLDTFDIVIFEENEKPENIDLNKSEAVTHYDQMKNNHCDFINLTLSKLDSISKVIYSKIKDGKSKRITKGAAKQLLRTAIEKIPELKNKIHTTLSGSL